MHKKLLIITVLANIIYMIWVAFHFSGAPGFIFFLGEFAIGSLSILFFINHWSQKHMGHSVMHPEGSLDVFLPLVDEPLYIFEPVLASVVDIDYPEVSVYVLDDGPRQEVAALAKKYGVTYLARGDTTNHGKAGNLNYGLAHSDGDYVLVIDADQRVTDLAIAKETLGHFQADPILGVLVTRQRFDVPRSDFNHDTLFYEHMQSGKNNDNAAISCGSGAIYRRSALNAIGGFQIWNIVEDLYTTYRLHVMGYRSLYINKAYTIGTAPMDLAGIYKQRGVWALDTLRMFLKDSPVFKRGLTFMQKMHYFELNYAYIVSALAIPVISVMPILVLMFRFEIVDDPIMYALMRVPSLVLLLYLYYHLGGRVVSTGQYWASLWPVYLKALVLAFLPGKPKYKVTSKVGSGKRDTILIVPHLLIVVTSLIAIGFYIGSVGVDMVLIANSIWITLMAFWFSPVIYKGLLKE